MQARWIVLLAVFAIPLRATDRAYSDAVRAELSGIDAPLVDVTEARKLMKNGAVILDTRTPEEFAVSHLPGARLVPFGVWQAIAGPALPADLARDKPIIVYCTIGWRSGKTTEALRARGYVQAVNLFGGIIQWHNEGAPLVDASGQATTRVHPYSSRWGEFIRQ